MADLEIKPCPFCGGEAELFEQEHGDCHPKRYYGVTCKKAGCWVYESAEAWEDTQGRAIERWNDRPITKWYDKWDFIYSI